LAIYLGFGIWDLGFLAAGELGSWDLGFRATRRPSNFATLTGA